MMGRLLSDEDLVPYQLRSEKGQPDGYATLGTDGKVPEGQLPVGGSGPFSLRELATDFTNSLITGADVTALGVTVAANATFQAHYYLVVDAAAATTGVQVALGGPALPAAVTIRWTMFNAAATATFAHQSAFGTFVANTASAGPTRTIWEALVVLRNGATAGTVVPQVRSEVAASAVNVRAGSWVMYH